MSKPETRRFSLIELLVVIAIVAILAAMLLPVLAQAKNKSRSILCLGQLRQWSIGLANYAVDADGYFPYNGDAAGWSPIGGRHVSWNSSVVSIFFRDYLLSEMDPATVTSRRNILYCPTQDWHYDYFLANQAKAINEGLVGYFYLPSRTTTTMSYAPAPVEWATKTRFGGDYLDAPIMMDMKQSNGTDWYYATYGSGAISSHASQSGLPFGGNFLFEDGHGRWYENEKIGLGGTYSNWQFWYKVDVD